MGKRIKVGLFDFNNIINEDIRLPENSIIFTSFCLHYLPDITGRLIQFILNLKPKIIINFEPCYESHPNTKFGEMCKRYIELNDYNNLVYLKK